MINLETDRLKFREWQPQDFPEFARFNEKKENAEFVGGVKTPEQAWRLMATYLGHYQLKGFSYLAMETKAEKALVGTVGLWKSDPWPEHELGYWLLPHMQGKGYAGEAGKAVLSFAKKLKLPSLVSYIDPANDLSKKLALKLGATLTESIDLLDFGPHEVYRYW